MSNKEIFLVLSTLVLNFPSFVLFVQASMQRSADIFFPGEQYLQIDNDVETSSYNTSYVNKIEMSFRTIHPSGVLVALTGASRTAMGGGPGGMMILQLFHGRLRYAFL